jgi:prepilin-type N-terminal cleavage/methylation domain-containing protein
VRRSGYTVIELIVAITLSAIVLLGARALWESLAASVDRMRVRAIADTRAANGERLLRSLLGRLEVGPDQSRKFAGGEQEIRFSTWCDMPSGWQERCDAVLAIEPDSDVGLRMVARLSTGETIMLQRGFTTGVLRYLNDPLGSGVWFRSWGQGFATPLAIEVITDRDTAIVRIRARE